MNNNQESISSASNQPQEEWQQVAQEYKNWHPGLHEHVETILRARGIEPPNDSEELTVASGGKRFNYSDEPLIESDEQREWRMKYQRVRELFFDRKEDTVEKLGNDDALFMLNDWGHDGQNYFYQAVEKDVIEHLDQLVVERLFETGRSAIITINPDAFDVPKDKQLLVDILNNEPSEHDSLRIDPVSLITDEKTSQTHDTIGAFEGLDAEIAFILPNKAPLITSSERFDGVSYQGGETKEHLLGLYKRNYAGLSFNEEFNKLENFTLDIALDADFAKYCIETGGVHKTALYKELHLFTELDNSIAHDMAKDGKLALILETPGSFDNIVFDTDLFESALEGVTNNKLQIHNLLESIDRFEGVIPDKSLFNRLTNKGFGIAILQHVNKFSSIDGMDLNGLIDAIDIQYVDTARGRRGDGKLLHYEVEKLAKGPDYSKLVTSLYKFEGIDDTTLDRLRVVTGISWLTEYPRDASEKIRDRWFADLSYVYMDGGFNKASIGHLIRTRIESGITKNIHDASYWLADFKIPDTAYDAQAVLDQLKQPGFEPESVSQVILKSNETERLFFDYLAALPEDVRARLNLSGKPVIVEQMFSNPTAQLLYLATIEKDENGQPFYKSAEFSLDLLVEAAGKKAENFSNTLSDPRRIETTTLMRTEELLQALQVWREADDPYDQPGLAVLSSALALGTSPGITSVMNQLKSMGYQRQRYIQDTQRWLERHITSPPTRLTQVWSDRGLALAYGVSDNARELEVWQKSNALDAQLAQREADGSLEELGITSDEVRAETNKPVIQELLRVMSAEHTLEAFSNMKTWQQARDWQEKILPTKTIEVTIDEANHEAKSYQFDILAADDPRGFTIGVDTGCCMTIEGESSSCIEAGYRYANAGFMALRTPQNKVAAQSFWYVHPDHSDTLVLDNIEANEGRDFNRILDVYSSALKDYVRAHPEIGITKVHVGTGYTDVNLGNLPPATPVPPLNRQIYTDADNQKLLFALGD